MAAFQNDPTGRRSEGDGAETAGSGYTDRLMALQAARWKTVLDVQRPYRWNLRRLNLGHCLDVGCGIGRNLMNLGANAVGVDHNSSSVAVCRARGLVAYTTEEFAGRDDLVGSFDSMLVAHVLEHVDANVGYEIIRTYLPYLKPRARVVLITPQEVGFRSDATHVRWVDHEVARAHAEQAGLQVVRSYSFPFPRVFGKVFIYNEFVSVMRLAGDAM